MLSSLKVRFRSLVCLLVFASALYSFLHLEILLPYELRLFVSDARASGIVGGEADISTDIPTAIPEDLTFTGAATYKIPIKTPPGRSGMAPSLSLMYNSHQRNGWVGVGWNLDVGTIQRSTKYAVNYSANDYVAVINGSYSELLPRSDWGANYYGSKIEGTFSKYYFNSSTGGWEVTTKEGTKYYYGATSASRQDNPNGVFKWCLDKVQDPNGNYMTVTFTKDQGEIYLDRIDYAGNGSLSTTNYVKFYLEDRTDSPPMYTTNALVKTAKRLNRIEVYGNGLLQSKYLLNYGYSTNSSRSLLSSITEYGSDGVSSLPATTFQWQESTTGLSLAWDNSVGGWCSDYSCAARELQMDVNGDGKTDLVRIWKNGNEAYAAVWLSDGTGFSLAWNGSVGGWCSDPSCDIRERAMDVNGDGKTDLVRIWRNGNEAYAAVWLSDGTGFYSAWNGSVGGWGDLIKDFPMDVNGDGKTDLVRIWRNGNEAWAMVCLSNGTGFSVAWNGSVGGWGDLIKDFPMDVNGDGKTDLVRIWQNGSDAYALVLLSDGTGFYSAWNGSVGAWETTESHYCYPNWLYASYPIQELTMDVNGDGKTDLVRIWKDANGNGAWAMVWLSNGTGFSLVWSGSIGPWWNGNCVCVNGSYICAGYNVIGGLPMDVNGDGKTDLVRIWKNGNESWATVWLSNGTGFSVAWNGPVGAWTASLPLPMDVNGDGKTDLVYLYANGSNVWAKVWLSAGAFPDIISSSTDSIGTHTEIAYENSSNYANMRMPFILHPIESLSVSDGKGNVSQTIYSYSGGLYDYLDREFRGFKNVTAYQMTDWQYYESKTETEFHQDGYLKGKVKNQTLTSKEGHKREVVNTWDALDLGNQTKFPRLLETTSTFTDVGFSPYSQRSTYVYDQYGNVKEEHKYGMTSDDEMHTYFSYTNFTNKWILSKPTDINVKNSTGSIVSRKWMDYDSNTGNMVTEEACKSDTPNTGCASRNATQNSVITYQYYSEGNLWKITDPMNYTTTLNYDSTKTFVYETINYLNHKTTTEYDPGTGKLKKLIPPHLQGTSYSFTNTYDVFGRKIREDSPDGGWTSYQYLNLGNPNAQYVEKREHIIGGVSPLDHYTFTYFDGLGRTYWLESTGPDGKRIITETWYDNLGRISDKSNPYFYGIDNPHFTTFTYDGLSRMIDVFTPDDYHIETAYQGLRKVVTNQRGNSTAYTYDVYQRLKKVEDSNGTNTEYSYDTLGNLTQVIAAKGNVEQNTTTMTYDSLSKKRTMNDPDMGYWTHQYDKSGNLTSQTDSRNQTITFNYDGLNRLTQKLYPDRPVTFTYDDPAIPYSKGKQTKVSDPGPSLNPLLNEDTVLEYDLLQRVKKSKKKIGTDEVTFEKSYDTAGRVLSIKYLAGTPNEKIYTYEYDVAGDILYIKENASGNHLIDYSDFTALGQQKIATFPKPNNVSVKTTSTYDPQTARLKTLITQKLSGAVPNDTYQNLDYQQFDGKGNLITLADTLNGITHSYVYDPLDRLLIANGVGTNPYSQNYEYDRIGNIIYKSDFGTYSYDYANKPHAVKSVVTDGPISGDPLLSITYNYDNKPELIKKNGSNYVQLTYDGSGKRVKKYNYNTGQSVLYFGELYEVRGSVGIIQVFAGKQRVASVLADGRTQFYHANHLGSASVISDGNGAKKEKIEYYPFGTYKEAVDYDSNFPDVFYTFTGQEDDDDLGLYNYVARLYDPALGRFISPDSIVPDSNDPQSLNRYSYVRNNPMLMIDPSGRAWEPTYTFSDSWLSWFSIPNGYQWIQEPAYNFDGTLKEGLTQQAIFFTNNGTFDPNSAYNMGSSTAWVYKADGTIEFFAATTYPSNLNNYPTLREGVYEARVGTHTGSQSSYSALRMQEVGGGENIELGRQNPAFPDRTYANGINIHKAGEGNKTGMTTYGTPISAGCPLIDRDRWNSFISIFNNSEQQGNTVSVTVSGTYIVPANINLQQAVDQSGILPYIFPRYR